MRKIVFGITSLQIGGAERVLVDLANRLCDKFDITIFTIYDNGKLKSQISSKIKIISLYDKSYEEFSKLQKIKISLKLALFDKAPVGYDTYVAFLEGPITRLFAKSIKQNNTKRIAWVHNDISKVFGKGLKSKIKRALDKKIYEKYDKIIFVSKENQEDFNKTYGNNFNEEIIKNYIDYNRVIEKSNEKFDNPFNYSSINFVTSCRLVEQKALDRFIKVHKKLEDNGFHSMVYVLGEGPLEEELKNQVKMYNVNDSFIFLGAKTNPYPYIKNADYFCLFSYYEGYGMVLEEAKILNKRILITDTAAKECIENYKDSMIFDNNENGIYNGLKEIIGGNNIRKNQETKTNNRETLINQDKIKTNYGNDYEEEDRNIEKTNEHKANGENVNNVENIKEHYEKIIEGIINIL